MPENMSKTPDQKTIKQHEKRQKSSTKNRTPVKTIRPKTVAIVGSRHNTRYGEEVAYKMAYELAKKGVVIVSGLAYGIDSIAHQACLDAGGITVAVLGTAIDNIYPTAHRPLAREIIDRGGAVMSEYGPGTEVFPKTSFLERNRIISGLADIVIVVEAAEKSGSLNTAAHAIDQGKEVFAVPGNITNPYSIGCNRLIRQGANPYTGPEDLLRLLFPEAYIKKRKKPSQTLLFGDTEGETAILRALSEGLRNGEDIMKVLGISASEFNQTMTLLEIRGAVRSLGANNWSLN
ncbi:DNA-processing protein DprA [Candidatus Saccharibacteria bacterium]|nr:DNA-processing protein DprA [Candidatus Saccharibacteria bacterium]